MSNAQKLWTPPVLLTSAVRPSAGRTVLFSEERRLSETVRSIKEWCRLLPGGTLVVCDGSGVDLRPFVSNSDAFDVNLEFLSFQNDQKMVRARGKGYGEGEIIEYALAASSALSEASAFAKCTGKLWVSNYASCARQFNGRASFDFNGWVRPRFIDTRFFIVDVAFYRSKLGESYKKVDDEDGFYLEHAFCQALGDLKVAEYAMTPTPRIHGVSGSTGITWQPSRSKALLRDARSVLVKALEL